MDEIKEMLRRIEERLARIESELAYVRNDTRKDGVRVIQANTTWGGSGDHNLSGFCGGGGGGPG